MDTQIFNIALYVVAGLFGTLAVVIGWLGARVIVKLDEMTKSINVLSEDLHGKIDSHNQRLTRAEVHIDRFNDEIFQRRVAKLNKGML